jgi:rubrerythrin
VDAQTRQNILAAMEGEAMATARYMLYAEQARRNGRIELASLFAHTATAELHEHFAELGALVGAVGDDDANLAAAIDGERYEFETLYRRFAAEAKEAGDTAAAARFEELRKDGRAHATAFRAARRWAGQTTPR